MTSGFLLDTNVISETMRPQPNPTVLDWLALRDRDAYLSVVTVGEIEAGIHQALARSPDDAKPRALRRWLEDALIPGSEAGCSRSICRSPGPGGH